jgi:hypothetical protein
VIAITPIWPADAEGLPLNLSGEVRLRYDAYENAGLQRNVDYGQTLFRGIIGAEFRLRPNISVHAEVGTGQVWGKRDTAPPSIQNSASLQKAFLKVIYPAGPAQFSAMIGRQEFAEGPRQLMSVGDGANLHRSWNGIRVQAQNDGARIGAIRFKATRLKRGLLDEITDDAERLNGFYGDLSLNRTATASSRVEAFWMNRRRGARAFREATGHDDTSTFGVKVSGHRARLSYDWTFARQARRQAGSKMSAWGFFASQTLTLSESGWKPRALVRLDVASGAQAGSEKSRGFDQLYSSSAYLGEGRFLSLRNLLLITSGVKVSPTYSTSVTADFGFARRLTTHDAAYAGGMREYAGTRNVGRGHGIGELWRVTASWQAKNNVVIAANIEHFFAGPVLRRAGLAPAGYASVSATYRLD